MAGRAGMALQSTEDMTLERWRVVTELFHAALDRQPNQRASFLREACRGDPSLRAEVDKLLAADQEAEAEPLRDPFDLGLPRLAAGTSLGPYQIERLIDAGGMGEVYEASDTRLGRTVAIKILPSDTVDSRQRERFRREARAISSLAHPHICTLFDIGEQDGISYLVIEYLTGETLARRLLRGPLPPSEVLRIGGQIADALDEAHRHRLIHRDIKPSNIFLTLRGDAKVLDFGLAKTISSAITTVTVASRNLTGSGEAVGTLAYMSPEQVRGETLDARTDLFSLGLVLYEMAAGRPAFTGSTSGVVAEAILNKSPDPPSQLHASVPSELDAIIAKALEKDVSLRYQHASDMRADLHRLRRDIESTRTEGAANVDEMPARRFTRIRRILLASVALLVTIVFASIYFLSTRRANALTDKDSILLADMSNLTGDPVFDDTLRQALEIQLEQSPFLTIVSEQRVADTLRLMEQPVDVKLTPAIARELCARTQSAAVLSGSIANLGTEYVLGLKATSCYGDQTLAEEQITALGKEHVLNALGRATSKLRARLGESLSSVRKYDTPIEQATTASLDALKAFSLGWNHIRTGDFAGAVPWLQRAVATDRTFAMGFAALGSAYGDRGETTLSAENARKAYELRDRVSERERFYIESHYYQHVSGDLEKTRTVYELWLQAYPRDSVPHDNLWNVYSSTGRHRKALDEAQASVQVDPANRNGYSELAISYLAVNRVDEARNTIERALTKNLDSKDLRVAAYVLAFLQKDPAGIATQVAWGADKPTIQDVFVLAEAMTAGYYGRLKEARALSKRAVEMAERAEENDAAGGYEADAALREALMGNSAAAVMRTQAALALSKGHDVEAGAALALAFASEPARAETLVDTLAARFPQDTLLQFNLLPTIRAQIALDRGNWPAALDALQRTAPFELGSIGDAVGLSLYPAYVRGEAYLAAHEGRAAAAEFQKILEWRGVVVNEPIGALAYLGLARACALQNPAQCRPAYDRFFTLWKDADSNVPILKIAKAEYQQLINRH
jgi:serine/threonine protein kinase/tetratricopeptide (TPR) repeat protein